MREIKYTTDNDGDRCYWVWTHIIPKSATGRVRAKRVWHAFNDASFAAKWMDRVDERASTQSEIGTGIPPKSVIDNLDYIDHIDEHLGR